jgi:hypothetical protein
MPDANELAQALWLHIQAFCKEHQCEVRLFAPLPPKLAELIGVTEAIIPATLLIVPKETVPSDPPK